MVRDRRLRRPAQRALSIESPAGPLAGVRVVAVEQFGAGPIATLLLRDLGAEVIKVEDPHVGGDVGRYVPPSAGDASSLFFEAFNRGKRSILLDLKTTGGREVFERLVASANALLSNVRGDEVDRLGLGYAALRHANPAIVCVALTGYGRRGPSAARPGLDHLVQAEAGWAYTTGAPDDPPIKSGLSLADYLAGMIAAVGLLAGLHRASATGIGSDVDVNLYDASLAMLTYPATWYLSAGLPVRRLPMSAHPSLTPFQFFATSNGYIAIACVKEKYFVALTEALEVAQLAGDRRFGTFAARQANADILLPILAARFREKTTDEWLHQLGGRVPCAPVRTPEQALDVGELLGREMLVEYEHERLGPVRGVASPIRYQGQPTPAEHRPAPGLGADRDQLLEELGLTREQVRDLADAGAFGARRTTDRG